MFGIVELIAAGEAARKASVNGRTVEVMVTEIGIIVRGGGNGRWSSYEVGWPQLESRSDAVLGAITFVVQALP